MSSRPSSFRLTSDGRLQLYSTEELLGLDPPTWQIDNVLPRGGLVGLYGPPGSFKSFVAIDWAMSIATGHTWQAKEVAHGPALYISGEGGVGIGPRARAWLQDRDLSPSAARKMMWLIQAISVYADSEDIDVLLDRVFSEVREMPSVVVVDTLARCFDGDENTQEDMGRFIKGVDLMREQFGATVIVVHHTRLGGDRERGNTAFRGAADTMVSVNRQGRSNHVTLECTKQKDALEFADMRLNVQQIDLGTHPLTGEDYGSAVIQRPQEDKTAQRHLMELAVLEDAGALKADDWLLLLQSNGVPRSTFFADVARLAKTGAIIKKQGLWQVAKKTNFDGLD